MSAAIDQIVDDMLTLLRDQAEGFGGELVDAADNATEFAAEQLMLLSQAYSEPGFDQAVVAARDAVAMNAGLEAVAVGDQADARFQEMMTGVMSIGARLLSVVI